MIRRKPALVSSLAIAGLLAMLFVSGGVKSAIRDAVAPYQRFLRRTGSWVENRGAVPASEVVELRRRIAELETEVEVLRAVENDYNGMCAQMGFAFGRPALIPAEVISVGGADGWSQRIRIGKGHRHGVRRDAPVVAPGGLVGRVIEVSESTADVLLVTDVNSKVACSFLPEIPGLGGIASGQGGQYVGNRRGLSVPHAVRALRLDYLGKDAKVEPGVMVVTSGRGGVYPPGIRVGRIGVLRPDPTGLYLQADVTSLVDFQSLRYVAVWRGAMSASRAGGEVL